MRKLILLVLSGAMLAGGGYVFVFELLLAYRFSYRFILGGAMMLFAGGYLIWTDFVAPRLGIKTWEAERTIHEISN